MRSDLERLKDIHEAIANIDKYVVRGRAAHTYRYWRSLHVIWLYMNISA
jgi:hypothetical protein